MAVSSTRVPSRKQNALRAMLRLEGIRVFGVPAKLPLVSWEYGYPGSIPASPALICNILHRAGGVKRHALHLAGLLSISICHASTVAPFCHVAAAWKSNVPPLRPLVLPSKFVRGPMRLCPMRGTPSPPSGLCLKLCPRLTAGAKFFLKSLLCPKLKPNFN